MHPRLAMTLASASLMVLAQCMNTAPASITEMTKAQMPLESDVAAAPASVADAGSLLNAFRRANGLAPLGPDAALMRAASAHAADMGRNGFMGHIGSNGSSLRDRTRAQGFPGCYIAENVARGQRSTQAVMTTWQNSPGHRRNMLNPRMRVYGFARGPGNTWALVLGEPGC